MRPISSLSFLKPSFFPQARNKKDFDLVICNNIMKISRQVIDQMAWNATIAMKDSTEAWIDISNYWID